MRISYGRMNYAVFACAVLLGLAGCAGKKDHFEAKEVGFQSLGGWEEEDHLAALEVFKKSCPILAAKARPETSGSDIQMNSTLWQSLCSEAQTISEPTDAKSYFERRFQPFRISNNNVEKGLFTGYYEPVLYGNLRKSGDFRYPVYAAPPELKTSKPYFTHAEIANGAIAKRGLEIAWVDDPVMLFFMQIQGSGRVRLPDGHEMRVGYSDQNGREYASLGKIFGDENLLPKDQINFFTIRRWLYDHQKQALELMQRNPSYVFFKVTNRPDGPVGSVGAPLTPQRSLAVDSSYIPYGLPLYLETELPTKTGPTPFRRLLIAQDTGGAIRSPVRGDIFFGAGESAEYLAGYMKGRGIYSLIVPKEISSQLR